MKIKTLLYILFMMAVALAQSCQKEKEPLPERPIPEYKLPDEFLRYFAFKPGSYWVYKNAKNGMLDTVTVTKYGFGYHTLISATDGKALYKYEDFNGQWHSSAYSANYDIVASPIRGAIDINSHGLCYTLTMGYSGPLGGGAPDWIMFYYLNSGSSYDLWNGGKINLTSIDTILHINSSMYDSVMGFNCGYSAIFYDSKVNLFYKKNIGMIRKINIDNGDDWGILNYKISY